MKTPGHWLTRFSSLPTQCLRKELHADLKELAPTWKGLKAGEESVLAALSRFELI